MKQAAQLVATVVGQDLEQHDDGVFRIAHRVAPDRVISTVDPEARHGHKTSARGFDGYKGHVAIDPDSELITCTAVSAGNAGDASVAQVLLADVLESDANRIGNTACESSKAEVYGDAAYATADLVERLEGANVEANVKVQPPSARQGMFSQDAFSIDIAAATACCPNGVRVRLRVMPDNARTADFAVHCDGCSLRQHCTTSKSGRVLRLHPKHETLTRARTAQRACCWKQRYRATRPKVERKIAHLMRTRHGGRRARLRGCLRIGHDFAMLAAAVNLCRLAVLGNSSSAELRGPS